MLQDTILGGRFQSLSKRYVFVCAPACVRGCLCMLFFTWSHIEWNHLECNRLDLGVLAVGLPADRSIPIVNGLRVATETLRLR